MTSPHPPPDHLIVVCGHGIWRGGPARGHDEAEWLIEAYKAGETPTFVAHIRAGLAALAADPRALLAFSGGPTRHETPLSEARSYADLAAANDFFGLVAPSAAAARILVEEQALDSYYNILFSLLAFWRHTGGAWPARLTVVSHAFKRARLVDAHCGPGAIAFLPLDRVAFVGINPPNLPAEFGGQTADADKAKSMADAHIVDHWTSDPHGVGALLSGKRRARNPWGVGQRLFASDAERQRSGLRTRLVGDDMEALADGCPQPWNDTGGRR